MLLEAMASGCAIVTASGSGCTEVVGDAALVVPPADIGATHQALGRLMDDPALCRDLGRQAHAKVEKTYGWNIVTERYVQLIDATVVPKPANCIDRPDGASSATAVPPF